MDRINFIKQMIATHQNRFTKENSIIHHCSGTAHFKDESNNLLRKASKRTKPKSL